MWISCTGSKNDGGRCYATGSSFEPGSAVSFTLDLREQKGDLTVSVDGGEERRLYYTNFLLDPNAQEVGYVPVGKYNVSDDVTHMPMVSTGTSSFESAARKRVELTTSGSLSSWNERSRDRRQKYKSPFRSDQNYRTPTT